MEIEIDTTSSEGVEEPSETLTWSHTVGSGSNTILVVCVPIRTGSDNPSSVKYNGEDLTLAHFRRYSYTNASVWYIVSPATGTNDITVNYTTSVWSRFAVGVSLFGVDQDNPVGATADNQEYNTTPNIDITTEKDNSYIFDVFSLSGGASIESAGTGQTEIGQYENHGASSYKQLSKAGATTMSWEISMSRTWTAVAVEFTEAPPSTGFLPLL